ncbi:MAG: hypothetical protein QM759_04750 [Terricaulis sp.]
MKAAIYDQLCQIASSSDFAEQAENLVDSWVAEGLGIEAVGPVLQFMQEHPAVDYGLPGALVHFVERFYRKGYEDILLESVRKQPTTHTVWMVNRVVNGADANLRQRCVSALNEAKRVADIPTRQRIDHFLARMSG